MKKLELYTGEKVYMFPDGTIATKEIMVKTFPAVLQFTHIIETDEAGEVAFAVENLAAMCSLHGVDLSLDTAEKIKKIEEIINTEPELVISNEERIAAALEAQVMMAMPDSNVIA